jgi:hypothetical protein
VARGEKRGDDLDLLLTAMSLRADRNSPLNISPEARVIETLDDLGDWNERPLRDPEAFLALVEAGAIVVLSAAKGSHGTLVTLDMQIRPELRERYGFDAFIDREVPISLAALNRAAAAATPERHPDATGRFVTNTAGRSYVRIDSWTTAQSHWRSRVRSLSNRLIRSLRDWAVRLLMPPEPRLVATEDALHEQGIDDATDAINGVLNLLGPPPDVAPLESSGSPMSPVGVS